MDHRNLWWTGPITWAVIDHYFLFLVLKIWKRLTKNKFGLVDSGLPRQHIYIFRTLDSWKSDGTRVQNIQFLFIGDVKVSEQQWLPALPFTRILDLVTPPLEGRDVVILQNLLLRHPDIKNVKRTGKHGWGFYIKNRGQFLGVFWRFLRVSMMYIKK